MGFHATKNMGKRILGKGPKSITHLLHNRMNLNKLDKVVENKKTLLIIIFIFTHRISLLLH